MAEVITIQKKKQVHAEEEDIGLVDEVMQAFHEIIEGKYEEV
jgi:hypothetical protein